MFVATVNPAKQLLQMTFVGQVKAAELVTNRENLIELLNQMKPGFRLLSDFSSLDSFGVGCPEEIGKNMHLLNDRGVAMVVRVIPDDTKDFGLNIISLFHYASHPNIITCCTMAEAARALSL